MSTPRSILYAVVTLAMALSGATAQRGPSFEVASVRENTSGSDRSSNSGPAPGRFTITNMPLRFIILEAFGLRHHQLIGAPGWTETTAYDIAATYPAGITPTDQSVRVMLQNLLAERFELRTHRDTRELAAYSLVLARPDGVLGSQLTRSEVDCDQWLAEKRPQLNAGGPSRVAPGGARPACMMVATRTFLSGGTRTIAQLGNTLQSMVQRPIIDRTGLTGAFDVDLRWGTAGNVTTSREPVLDDASIFTALQEQLGLKLESVRAPFDIVVIDSVRRPTAD